MVSDPGYMGFIGVTTGSSSIMKIFPHWAEALGLPTTRLIGHDVALNADREAYQEIVTRIHNDPLHWGALVTTHKMAVFDHAAGEFDSLDDLAVTFAEISSIAKRGDRQASSRLTGAAKDPVTVQLALEEFLPHDHFARTKAAALVLGAGGSGNSLTYNLGVRSDAPTRVIVAARREESLRHARALHERAGIDSGLMEYALIAGPADVDRLIESLPPESLVVNATGMGKDRPGSPMSDSVVLPERGVVWEFNYRGSLEFLAQARAQEAGRSLHIEDGWRYFIHGWTQVIADVFDIGMPPETVDRLAEIAGNVR